MWSKLRFFQSQVQCPWMWIKSGRSWRSEEPAVLPPMVSQRVRHGLATEWMSQWSYLIISSSASPFSFYLQSLPVRFSRSFQMNQLFRSGGQNTGTSASVLPMNIQGWFPLDRISLVAQMVKNLPAVWETWVQSLGQEDPLEKGMATHFTVLAWRTPWTEVPSRLQSMGSQTHDWATHFTFTSFRIAWFNLLAVQGTQKSLLQHHNSKPSILWH